MKDEISGELKLVSRVALFVSNRMFHFRSRSRSYSRSRSRRGSPTYSPVNRRASYSRSRSGSKNFQDY